MKLGEEFTILFTFFPDFYDFFKGFLSKFIELIVVHSEHEGSVDVGVAAGVADACGIQPADIRHSEVVKKPRSPRGT